MAVKQGPFVNFIEIPQKDKLTRVWRVEAILGGTLLGGVRWKTAWRRYTFEPMPDTVFDANCLWDIADFCASMTAAQKEDQAKRRAQR